MIIEGMPKRNVRRKAEKKIVRIKEPKKKGLVSSYYQYFCIILQCLILRSLSNLFLQL